MRYETETKMLSYLARRQLNLDKNRVKESFESMSFDSILQGLKEEILELTEELESSDLNVHRFLEELGDCAAYLVGLIAWVNERNK